MKSLKESVVTALDGSDKELFFYLPYLLQDLWQMGADPKVMIKLIYKHTNIYHRLRVLDLGCGKGAVLIKTAKEFGCTCLGVDAVKEFIQEAKEKAKQWEVSHLCQFKVGDIRKRIKKLKGFDIIILGAIGPVLGNYYETLKILSKCLAKGGKIIIDDGYIEDSSDYVHAPVEKKSVIVDQINSAGMRLIDEKITNKEEIKKTEGVIAKQLKKRCQELIEKYPDKEKLFQDYLKNQKEEKEALETKITCSTMVIEKA